MWSPGLVYPMFCHLVAPLVFPQDPQETGETRDYSQSIKAEGSGAVGMEEEQVAVLRVLHACFFVTFRGRCAPCCACCAFYAFSCLASAVPLENQRHVVRVLQKPPPETEGEEAKEGPKKPA